MGYLKGYDCDICGFRSEDEDEFIGLATSAIRPMAFAVDSADFHVCIRCARVIADAVKGGVR
jgi:hypothetical protein